MTSAYWLGPSWLLPVVWAGYVAVVAGLHRRVKFDRPWLTMGAVIHNALLAVGSLVMLLGVTNALIAEAKLSGVMGDSGLFCRRGVDHMPEKLFFWIWIFYLSKFYELIDTIILLLRGKELTLLHVWHHASVIAETHAWMAGRMTMAWTGMLFNTFVHVLMYSYYALTLLGIKVWWKRYLTQLQIVQFITSFAVSIPFLFYAIWGPGCDGMSAWVLSAFINGSYLLLFVRFFRKTYSVSQKAKGR